MCGVSDTCHPTCLQEVTLWSKKLQCAHKGTETTERVALASRGMSREEGPGPHSFIEERRTPEADEAGHTLSQKSEQGRQARQEPPRGAARGRAAAYTPRDHGEGAAGQFSGSVQPGAGRPPTLHDTTVKAPRSSLVGLSSLSSCVL